MRVDDTGMLEAATGFVRDSELAHLVDLTIVHDEPDDLLRQCVDILDGGAAALHHDVLVAIPTRVAGHDFELVVELDRNHGMNAEVGEFSWATLPPELQSAVVRARVETWLLVQNSLLVFLCDTGEKDSRVRQAFVESPLADFRLNQVPVYLRAFFGRWQPSAVRLNILQCGLEDLWLGPDHDATIIVDGGLRPA